MPQTPLSDPSGAPDSSRASWAAANPLVADAGPEFDPEQPREQATPLAVADVAWEAGRVRSIVRAQGLMTHQAIGIGEEDWLWRTAELDALSEPLANVLNKVPVTRAAAAVSDELTVGAVMFQYAARSIKERSQVIRARKAAAERPRPQPVTGVDAAGRRVEPLTPEQVSWEVPT